MTRHSTATGKEAFSDSMNWYLSSTLSRRRPWPFLKPPFQSATYELLREVSCSRHPPLLPVRKSHNLPVPVPAATSDPPAGDRYPPACQLGGCINLFSDPRCPLHL